MKQKTRFVKLVILLAWGSLMMVPGCYDDGKKSLPLLGAAESQTDGAVASDTVIPGQSAVITQPGGSVYLIGTGIYDITGPAAEVGMMGFADLNQKTSGIHMRLRSRAFVIGDGSKRVVFVSADLGMMFQMVKMKVCEKIAQNPQLANYYNDKNVLLSAIHTHSGPGGYSGYFLYDFTVLGFIRQNFDVIVNGIYQSILLAHNNARPGKILINEGTLTGVGGNRSQFAYDNDPAAERAAYDGSADTSFTLLKFVTLEGEEIGMLNWFAVHPTSIGPTNYLISGDNKGYASYLFEKDKGTNYLSQRTFVAAFAQANAGDVSPNVGYGQAPADVDFEHNRSLENATMKQYGKAKELYDGATRELSGPINFRHEYVNMSNLYIQDKGCTSCAAAMGASFSAGSITDNPSPAPLFPAGTTVDSLNWTNNSGQAFLQGFLSGIFAPFWPKTQDPAYKKCHAEKPILIPTGAAGLNLKNIPMTPEIMPFQVITIGSMAIVAVPNEVTTMSGRRLKALALSELRSAGIERAVIASMANAYSSYLATREEYAKQSYEGASTQFGPNQLTAYQQEYTKIFRAIAGGIDVAPGPIPRDLTNDVVNFQTGVVFDDKPLFNSFGDVITQPGASYARGAVVSVQFWGGHPKNNLQTQGSYLVVEKIVNGSAVPVAYDWDPETIYLWQRDGVANSKITIKWNTKNAQPGQYRIRHRGHWKSGWTGKISPYEGVSRTFTVN